MPALLLVAGIFFSAQPVKAGTPCGTVCDMVTNGNTVDQILACGHSACEIYTCDNFLIYDLVGYDVSLLTDLESCATGCELFDAAYSLYNTGSDVDDGSSTAEALRTYTSLDYCTIYGCAGTYTAELQRGVFYYALNTGTGIGELDDCVSSNCELFDYYYQFTGDASSTAYDLYANTFLLACDIYSCAYDYDPSLTPEVLEGLLSYDISLASELASNCNVTACELFDALYAVNGGAYDAAYNLYSNTSFSACDIYYCAANIGEEASAITGLADAGAYISDLVDCASTCELYNLAYYSNGDAGYAMYDMLSGTSASFCDIYTCVAQSDQEDAIIGAWDYDVSDLAAAEGCVSACDIFSALYSSTGSGNGAMAVILSAPFTTYTVCDFYNCAAAMGSVEAQDVFVEVYQNNTSALADLLGCVGDCQALGYLYAYHNNVEVAVGALLQNNVSACDIYSCAGTLTAGELISALVYHDFAGSLNGLQSCATVCELYSAAFAFQGDAAIAFEDMFQHTSFTTCEVYNCITDGQQQEVAINKVFNSFEDSIAALEVCVPLCTLYTALSNDDGAYLATGDLLTYSSASSCEIYACAESNGEQQDAFAAFYDDNTANLEPLLACIDTCELYEALKTYHVNAGSDNADRDAAASMATYTEVSPCVILECAKANNEGGNALLGLYSAGVTEEFMEDSCDIIPCAYTGGCNPCSGGPGGFCNDGDACTIDICTFVPCDIACQFCENDPNNAIACADCARCLNATPTAEWCFYPSICDDFNACTDDVCDGDGNCSNTPKDCNDGIACTIDGCDPSSGCTNNAANCCGDGVVLATEQCDDTNTNDGDGCSSTCTVETGFICTGEPSVCTTTCGDGLIAGTEQCDDGNTSNGDGCSGCLIEQGFYCTGTPSVCTTTCGDGMIAGTEQCDDLNTNDGDGCSSTCVVEPGYQCLGVPSACTLPCGGSCEDNNVCTVDFCDNNVCGHTAVNCDDNNVCTFDYCIPNGNFGCNTIPTDCEDLNACTTEHCENPAGCVYVSACDDNNPCTIDLCNPACDALCAICTIQGFTEYCQQCSTCLLTMCIHIPVNCDDGDACTDDLCDANGQCQHTPTNCEDFNGCTIDACNSATGCTHTTKDCSDTDICTDDFCQSGSCRNVTDFNCCHDATDCEDGNPCTTNSCDANLCVYPQINCDDFNYCTTDICENGQCEHSNTTNSVCERALEIGCGETIKGNNVCYGDAFGDNCGRYQPFGVWYSFTGICGQVTLSTGCVAPMFDLQLSVYSGTCDALVCVVSGEDELPGCDPNNATVTFNSTPGVQYWILVSGTGANPDNTDTFSLSFTCTEVDCDDNTLCTDDICTNGVCSNPVKNCDDGDPCTRDWCPNPTSGCIHPAEICDDFNLCTQGDHCEPGVGCVYPTACNDNNPCTNDICNSAPCQANCNVCQAQGFAQQCEQCSTCIATALCIYIPVNCDDGDACTDDLCDANGQCQHTPTNCEDFNGCTIDACNSTTGCSNTVKDCSDTDICTDDFCQSGSCRNVTDFNCCHDVTDCEDGDACTTNSCDANLCVYTPVFCYDFNFCTNDVCDNGQCTYPPVITNDVCSGATAIACGQTLNGSNNCGASLVASCGAADDLNGVWYSFTGSCGQTTIRVCGVDSDLLVPRISVYTGDCSALVCHATAFGSFGYPGCSSGLGADVTFNTTAGVPYLVLISGVYSSYASDNFTISVTCNVPDCNDNNLCTNDFCENSGACGHTAVNCDDGKICTNDFCATGQGCWNLPLSCEDGDFCTEDYCDTLVGCITPAPCDDGDACTEDVCNPAACSGPCDECYNNGYQCIECKTCVRNSCTHTPISCDDGNFCTIDACDSISGCSNEIDTANALCCTLTADCATNICSTVECVNNTCTYTNISCDDSDPCTDDFCDNTTGCYSLPRTCFDLSNCTNDFCSDSAGGCYFVPVNCDDGDACTIDNCTDCGGIPSACFFCSLCSIFPNPSCAQACEECANCVNGCSHTPICNDNNLCTTDDCDGSGNCTYTPIDCSDGDLCTDDSCDPSTGICSHIAVDCADLSSCTVDSCNSANGQCVNADTVITNEICSGAYALTCGQTFTGNTFCADHDNIPCGGPAISNTSMLRGVWFSYTAVECGAVTVSTCNAQLTSHIVVFTGDCNSLTCVTSGSGNAPSGCDPAFDASITFNATAGTQYLIGLGSTNTFYYGGPYSITINCAGCNDNNACTKDTCISGQCTYTNIVCDDGNPCTVNTCDPTLGCGYPFDCVVSGGGDACCSDNNACTQDVCNVGLQCTNFPINCNDFNSCTNDNCVNGQCQHLSVSENDRCSGAQELQCGLIGGSTDDLCAFADTVPECGNPTPMIVQNGLWYTFVGDCGEARFYVGLSGSEHNVVAYSGECNALTCIGFASLANAGDGITITTNPGTRYYFLVYPTSTPGWYDYGFSCTQSNCDDGNTCSSDYCVDGQCTHLPKCGPDSDLCTLESCDNGTCVSTPVTCDDNNSCTIDACNSTTGCSNANPDKCADAIELVCGQTVTLSNTCATDDPVPYCGGAGGPEGPAQHSVWFGFTGTGSPVTISTCNSNTLAMFAVFTGSCGSLVCETGAVTGGCAGSSQASLTFCTVAGTHYFIMLHSYQQVGTYQLSITCADCDDNTACTRDLCVSGTCVNEQIDCDDKNMCTLDSCAADLGCGHRAIVCDDHNACTTNSCNPNAGCQFNSINCSDGIDCTVDACNLGVCTHDSSGCDPCAGIDCSDRNLCTADYCNNGNCEHSRISCADGNACTVDTCFSDSGCNYSAANCNDNNACTVDNCDSNTGCTNVNRTDAPVITKCETVTCDPALGWVISAKDCNDNNACTNDACDLGTGACLNIQKSCDDGNPCTIDGTCTGGVCSNIPKVCNDNNVCTNDFCDPTSGLCMVSNNNAALCSDNNLCTIDACVNGTCISTAKVCNDSNPCTTDACNSSNGNCIYTPQNGVISFTLVNSATDQDIRQLNTNDTIKLSCNPNVNIRANTCGNVSSVRFNVNGNTGFRIENDPPYALVGDAPPGDYHKWNVSPGLYTIIVTPYTANNAGGTAGTSVTLTVRVLGPAVPCAPQCTSPVQCNDNNACTNDFCLSGHCAHTAKNCNDNDACTTDGCNTATGGCTNIQIACNDNNNCTIDICSSSAGCVYLPKDCNDGVTCTNDICLQSNGSCVQIPVNCDDNNKCTIDQCNPTTGGCIYTPKNCNDANLCTTDGCNTSNGSCTNIPIVCNDNNTCTTDNCTPTTGCQFTGNPNCCTSSTQCNDNDICTNDLCTGGQCTHALAVRVVQSFILINSATDTEIGPLNNGDIINLNVYPKINVRANLCTNTGTGSVRFKLNSNNNFRTESDIPYALAGDNPTNQYYNWNVTPGVYTITATPYQNSNATGAVGTAKTITITIIKPSAKMSGEENNIQVGELAEEDRGVTLSAYPNPFNDRLNIEFSLPEDSKVKLEVFNLTGQRLASLFEGDIKAAELKRLEYIPITKCDCMIIYRLQTQRGTFYNKAIMVN